MSAKFCFRPKIESLEGREVPAAFSALLSDGAVVSGQFTTPQGVDPGQASQSIAISDLMIGKGNEVFDVQGTATADYQNGQLIGVTATALGEIADETLTLADGTVTITAEETVSGGVAYDAADTEVTFALDRTIGAISYNIPWDSVDPTQASQSLTPTNFNLNIAGQNLTGSSLYFTTTPTVQFANGEFVGLNFALNTSTLAGFPYSSLSMAGLNVTAQPLVGQTFNVLAAVKNPAIDIEFSTWFTGGNNLTLSITWKLSDGTDDGTTIQIPSGTSKETVRTLVYSVLDDNGLKPTAIGNTELLVKGTAKAQLTEFRLSVTGQSNAWTGPTYKGRVATVDISPAFYLNGDKKSP